VEEILQPSPPGLMKKKKSVPILYQNFEFQYWKTEKSIRSKSGVSTELPKIALIEEEPNELLGQSEEKPQAKGELSSPMIKSQIMSFFPSLNSPSKDSDKKQGLSKSEETLPSKIQQYNNPFAYAPSINQQQYAQAYYPNYAYQQGYTPIYVPVMFQPMPTITPYPTQDKSSGPVLTGRLKFFEESQNYGFFILDSDNSDLFVHYDELLRAGLTKDLIRLAKVNGTRFSFRSMKYYGKYDLSQKAVDVHILQDSSGYIQDASYNYMMTSYPQ